MTAVVLAKSYPEAADAARLLGLRRDWVYPHQAYLLRGVEPSLVVYVEGWTESAVLTAEVLEALRLRMTDDTPVERVTMREWGPGIVGVQSLAQPVADMTQPEPDEPPASRRSIPWALGSAVFILSALLGAALAKVLGW